jgi:hypothetical protein
MIGGTDDVSYKIHGRGGDCLYLLFIFNHAAIIEDFLRYAD